jgi:carbamoyl-phosphate synthase large subunit
LSFEKNLVFETIRMSETKRVLVICGGTWQIPIVRAAKRLGCCVACSNLYEDSPAFAYADEHFVCDVLDIEANYRFAERWKPDAIVTDQTDIAVVTVATLCERLGLPGIGSGKARLFTNKYEMCRATCAAGIDVPDFRLCETADDALPLLKQYGKIILKPLDSQSSRGVFSVESEADLRRMFPESQSCALKERGVLAEQYIEGTEFTVDGLMGSDGYHVLAISEKSHYPHLPNVANMLLFSNAHDSFDYDALRERNHALIEALDLPFGLTHTEYKYQDGRYYLIETAARGGGTKISSDIAPYMSGVDSSRALLRLALGEEVSAAPQLRSDRFAILEFPDLAPGRVAAIDGIDEIRALPGVVEFGIDVAAGKTIAPIDNDRGRPAWLIAFAETRESLEDIRRQVRDLLHIRYA